MSSFIAIEDSFKLKLLSVKISDIALFYSKIIYVFSKIGYAQNQ